MRTSPERARAVVLASSGTGDVIPNATVTVRNPGTAVNISETIYVNDDPDTSQYTNGAFFTSATGLVTFYLTNQKRVDVLFSKSGWTSVTIPVDVQKSSLVSGESVATSTIWDAAGDLAKGTGADTAARLARGTANQVLRTNAGGTDIEWGVDPAQDKITTAGDLLYGTAADTAARLGIGTAGQVLKVNAGATAPEWGAAASGGLLTSVYDRTSTSPTTTSTTSVDVLAALAVTFIAPASGVVLVRLTGHLAVNDAADVRWNLREGAADVANTEAVVLAAAAATATRFIISKAIKVTGLTAGNSYTYKWGWRTTAGTATLHIAGAATDASMEVWSA